MTRNDFPNARAVGMKTLLVQPNYRYARESQGGRWGVNPPIGLGYIAAVLEENGIAVSILDANALDLSEEAVAEHIGADRPNIVGISTMTPAHTYAVNVAQLIKKKNDDCLLVAGGPHATALPGRLLAEGFDVIVRGEGEYAFLDLARGKKLETIAGISFRQGETVQHNSDRPAIRDVDGLPFPAWHLLPSNGVDLPYLSTFTRYRPWAPIVTSRGCPFGCYYCTKHIFGRFFRARSPQNVLSELRYLKDKLHVREIDVYDDCFNFDLRRAEEILDLIIAEGLDLTFRFSNGLRADRITEDLVAKMKAAGTDYVAFGIESGDQDVLNKIPKGVTLDMIRSAVSLTKRAGITVTGFFMLGLVGDTKETMRKTIDFAKELDLDVASFGITTPYPGTGLWEMVMKDGQLLTSNLDELFHTSGRMLYKLPGTASPEEVEEAYRRAHKDFYFRTTYILRQLSRARSYRQIQVMAKGLKAVLKIRKGQ